MWLSLLIGLSLSMFSVGTYFIWFSKKNIFNHVAIGFCFVAYIVPLCILNLNDFGSRDTIQLYISVNIVGAFFFLLGIILGYKWKSVPVVDAVMRFQWFNNACQKETFWPKTMVIVKYFYIVSVVVMALSFMYMGFLPMFAADPGAAKQFKGIYQPRYQHVALFYRTAKQFIQLLMPFLLIEFYGKRKMNYLIWALVGMLLVFVSISRSETVAGLLLISSIVIVLKKSNTFFFGYIVFYVLIFSIGSSFWVIAAYYFPEAGFGNFSDQTVAGAISSGAPDIIDQVRFLDAFLRNHVDFTYGLTFLGGLIPFNFKWNTSVWTLTVLNQTDDISEIASGGLRLPVSMWGYLCFGWPGVALLPFTSAFLTGYMIKHIKKLVSKLKANYNGYMSFYFLAFLFLNIGVFFTDFYRISIYFFPAVIFYGLVIYTNTNKKVGNIA